MCDLNPPAAVPAPLFSIDEDGHLVYNSSRRSFWACPVNLGENIMPGRSYFLELPGRAEGKEADRGGWRRGDGDWMEMGGVCKSVKIDVPGFVDAWICNWFLSFSSSSFASVSPSSSVGGEKTRTASLATGTGSVSWTEPPSSVAARATVTVTVTVTSTSGTTTITVDGSTTALMPAI